MWVVYYYSTMHLFWPQCYKMVFWPLENRPILTVVKKILRNRLKEETDAHNLLFAVNFTVWHRFKIHLVIILVQCLWLLQLWKLDQKKKLILVGWGKSYTDQSALSFIIYQFWSNYILRKNDVGGLKTRPFFLTDDDDNSIGWIFS